VGFQQMPAYTEFRDEDRKLYVQSLDGREYTQGSDVVLRATALDQGNNPPSRVRKGFVIVKDSQDGIFSIASDPLADRNLGAVVAALQTADATWAGKTITVFVRGRPVVTVPLGANTNTDALVVQDLMANATFAQFFQAAISGARVQITSLETGADLVMTVTSTIPTAFGAHGTDGAGKDADYRVTAEPVDLVDPTGAPSNNTVKTSLKAYYLEAALIGLTGEARAVLARRGALFGQ
jgi:hypothetical protein